MARLGLPRLRGARGGPPRRVQYPRGPDCDPALERIAAVRDQRGDLMVNGLQSAIRSVGRSSTL
jgi:hypothetical protein